MALNISISYNTFWEGRKATIDIYASNNQILSDPQHNQRRTELAQEDMRSPLKVNFMGPMQISPVHPRTF